MSNTIVKNEDYVATEPEQYNVKNLNIPGTVVSVSDLIAWLNANFIADLAFKGGTIEKIGTNVNAAELNAIQKNCLFEALGVRSDQGGYENYILNIDNLDTYWTDVGAFDIKMLVTFNESNTIAGPKIKIGSTEYFLKLNGQNLAIGAIQTGFQYFVILSTSNSTAVLQKINIGKTLPSGEIVGTSDSQGLTNKTINADQNTVSNLKPSNVKAENIALGSGPDDDKFVTKEYVDKAVATPLLPGTNYISQSDTTEDQLWEKLNGFIPVIGNKIALNGSYSLYSESGSGTGFISNSSIKNVVYAERISTNTINIYGNGTISDSRTGVDPTQIIKTSLNPSNFIQTITENSASILANYITMSW